MSKAIEIIETIYNKKEAIIDNLDVESVEVYKFLQKEFQKGNIINNALFQFVYRSFYRIDNAGLTPEFKQEYFTIMEKLRHSSNIDVCTIINELYHFPRRKGDKSIQFSFSTKLINTIDPSYPIYDSEVTKVFSFSTYYLKDKDEKIKRYLSQHQTIQNTYHIMLTDERIHSVLNLFDKKFPGTNIHPIKKLDFIVWSTGKILGK